MKKLHPHWIGLAAWFAIVAAAVGACSGGNDGKPSARQTRVSATAATQAGAALER